MASDASARSPPRPWAEATAQLLNNGSKADALAAKSELALAITAWDGTGAAAPADRSTLHGDLLAHGARCARIALGSTHWRTTTMKSSAVGAPAGGGDL